MRRPVISVSILLSLGWGAACQSEESGGDQDDTGSGATSSGDGDSASDGGSPSGDGDGSGGTSAGGSSGGATGSGGSSAGGASSGGSFSGGAAGALNLGGDTGSGGMSSGGTSSGGHGSGGESGDSSLIFEDLFEGASLSDEWTVKNAGITGGVGVSGGQLTATVKSSSIWWTSDESGLFVHQPVTETNFSVTVTARPRRADNPSAGIDSGLSFIGLMVRNPASDGGVQNYLAVQVGHLSAPSWRTTDTLDDNSSNASGAWTAGDAELRICKVGHAFRLYVREVGSSDPFTMLLEKTRADLNVASLQVGMSAYTFNHDENNELEAQFDQIRAEKIESFNECAPEPT